MPIHINVHVGLVLTTYMSHASLVCICACVRLGDTSLYLVNTTNMRARVCLLVFAHAGDVLAGVSAGAVFAYLC